MGNATAGSFEDFGMHYESVKLARKYDLWRREMGFDSFDDLVKSFEEAAKLLNEHPAKYIDDCYNTWLGDRK